MGFDKVKDSGVREEMPTGSRRDTREGKGRYDLLPTFGVHRLAQHFENGAKKYGDRNWELGQPLSRLLDSGIRHAFNYLQGQADEDHLAGAVWNLICALDTEERIRRGLLPADLDDLTGNPSGVDVSKDGSNLDELRRRLRESGFCKEPNPPDGATLNPEYLKLGPLYEKTGAPVVLTGQRTKCTCDGRLPFPICECNATKEETPADFTAVSPVPEGYRLLRAGETIPEDARFRHSNRDKWRPARQSIGFKLLRCDVGNFCAPVVTPAEDVTGYTEEVHRSPSGYRFLNLGETIGPKDMVRKRKTPRESWEAGRWTPVPASLVGDQLRTMEGWYCTPIVYAQAAAGNDSALAPGFRWLEKGEIITSDAEWFHTERKYWLPAIATVGNTLSVDGAKFRVRVRVPVLGPPPGYRILEAGEVIHEGALARGSRGSENWNPAIAVGGKVWKESVGLYCAERPPLPIDPGTNHYTECGCLSCLTIATAIEAAKEKKS